MTFLKPFDKTLYILLSSKIIVIKARIKSSFFGAGERIRTADPLITNYQYYGNYTENIPILFSKTQKTNSLFLKNLIILFLKPLTRRISQYVCYFFSFLTEKNTR